MFEKGREWIVSYITNGQRDRKTDLKLEELHLWHRIYKNIGLYNCHTVYLQMIRKWFYVNCCPLLGLKNFLESYYPSISLPLESRSGSEISISLAPSCIIPFFFIFGFPFYLVRMSLEVSVTTKTPTWRWNRDLKNRRFGFFPLYPRSLKKISISFLEPKRVVTDEFIRMYLKIWDGTYRPELLKCIYSRIHRP